MDLRFQFLDLELHLGWVISLGHINCFFPIIEFDIIVVVRCTIIIFLLVTTCFAAVAPTKTTTHLPPPALTSREFPHGLDFFSTQEWFNLMLRQHFILDMLGLFSNDTTSDFLRFTLPISSILVLDVVSNKHLQSLLDPIQMTIKLGPLETSHAFPFYQFNQTLFTLDPTVKSTIIDSMLTCKFSNTEFVPILGVGLQLSNHGQLLLSRIFFTSGLLDKSCGIGIHSSSPGTIQGPWYSTKGLFMSTLTSGRCKSRSHTIPAI
mmetsp:Transcript_25078/g.39409  ORF Transcript_25078/g.39409 Transcript_25078/m.39409 type:complete len:263 (+) Transcript_25078:359-1147(+)